MSWNYRVVAEGTRGVKPAWRGRRDALPVAETVYTIREVYYGATGQIQSWTASGAVATGVSLDELRAEYTRQADAFTKPVLFIEKGQLLREGEPV